jgi:antibiotic biosynthesis monooxygenase (ABM) superfamily enzyme
MISIHCGAHRLALASSQAAHAITYLKRFDEHLNTIFYHFANSSVREAALHKVQSMIEEPVLCLKKAAFTRWLSHDQAITTIHN